MLTKRCDDSFFFILFSSLSHSFVQFSLGFCFKIFFLSSSQKYKCFIIVVIRCVQVANSIVYIFRCTSFLNCFFFSVSSLLMVLVCKAFIFVLFLCNEIRLVYIDLTLDFVESVSNVLFFFFLAVVLNVKCAK